MKATTGFSIRISYSLAAVIAIYGWLGGLAQESKIYPPAAELLSVIRSNVTGLAEKELNGLAVQGILEKLDGYAVLEGGGKGPVPSTNASKQSKVFENFYGYIRVGQLTSSTVDEVKALLATWKTNQLKGLVLDLRFAGGTDYSGAAKLADFFIPTEKSLLDWGEGMIKSTAKENPTTMPVAILVNQRTRGSSEAFAGAMRHTETGLLIGSTTSGTARLFTEIQLSTGQKLKVASGPVKLGDGKALPMRGVPPDIQVTVNPDDEKAWFEDPYRNLNNSPLLSARTTPANTNRASRRLNEAELVRLQKDGRSEDDGGGPDSGRAERDPAKPLVRDPALSRALDLLKGLAVVQQQQQARQK